MMNTQIMRSLIKCLSRKIMTGFILGLVLSLAQVSIATSKPKPPHDRKPPSDYSRSTGPRSLSCPTLRSLAPQTYVGHTVSARPTFVWVVSHFQETKLERFPETQFRLFELVPNGRPKQIGNPINLSTLPGINNYSLPENQPELTIGKTYFWQVAILCRTSYIIQKAEFIVVQIPPALKGKLTTKVDTFKKAELYAEAGLWYDALAEALKLSKNRKLGQLGSSILQSLALWEEPITPEEAGTPGQQKEIQQRIKDWEVISIREK